MASGEELKKRAKAHLGRPLPSSSSGTRRAVEHERARRPGLPVGIEGDAVVQAHGQRPALTPAQVEVERLGPRLARRAGGRDQHRDDRVRHDVGQLQPARSDLGEVVPEPLGKGGVHVDDRPGPVGRQEARGRMVEIVDRVLQLLEDGLVPLAVLGNVRDAPQRRHAAARAGQWPHAQPVPAELARTSKGGAEPHLFRCEPALARGLRQPVDRLGDLGPPVNRRSTVRRSVFLSAPAAIRRYRSLA
jgi:hypothetical protein